jgi:DNA polymerase alpha subunit B
MAMHLSEASEVLDDRIDEFMTLVQVYHELEDSAFGNAASQSTSEIVAVGRIASDMLEGKFNSASIVLETSRRMGAGLRVPSKSTPVPSYEFSQARSLLSVVSMRLGSFSVNEVFSVPLLPPAASLPGRWTI